MRLVGSVKMKCQNPKCNFEGIMRGLETIEQFNRMVESFTCPKCGGSEDGNN